jgi:AcrR family transcriptional regulator
MQAFFLLPSRSNAISSPTRPVSTVNVPRQKRSRETQARILAAVSAYVNSGDYQNVTVQDIVNRAKCSVGAFYGRFKDKDAALYLLFDERCLALETLAQSALFPDTKSGNLDGAIDAFIHVVVRQTMANAAILRAGAGLTSARASEPFWARAKAMNKRFFDGMENLLQTFNKQHSHPNSKQAALYTVAVIGGLSRDAVLIGRRLVAQSENTDSFQIEIRRMVRGYLGIATAELDLR